MSTASTAGGGSRGAWNRRIEGLSGRVPRSATFYLALALAISGAILIAGAGHIVFFADEWPVVTERRGLSADAFLDPLNGHLHAGLVVFYKALLATFGMESPVPFHAAAAVVHLTVAALLFAYARSRVGDWLALMAAVLIAFFGAANQDLLSPFQVCFLGSVAAGLGALLALDREDQRGDLIACLLLVVSVLFIEVGLAFAVGALVLIVLEKRQIAARLYVPLVPIALYGLWWLGWGHTAPSQFELHNIPDASRYVLDAAGAATASLAGLASASDAVPEPVGQEWGAPLLVAALALAGWRVRQLGRIPPGVWPVLAIGLTFWLLAAFSAYFGRAPGNGRFLYASAVFVLLIAVELLRGVRPRTPALRVLGGITVLVVLANLEFLYDGYHNLVKHQNEQQRAVLRAIEDTGEQNRDFVLTESVTVVAQFHDFPVGPYLDAVRDYGSPAYSEAELAGSPEDARVEADRVYAGVLGVSMQPGGSTRGPCFKHLPSTLGLYTVELVPGIYTFEAPSGPPAEAELGRYADGLSVDLGTLQPESIATLTLPGDRAQRPWRLGFVGAGDPVLVCGPWVRASGLA